MNDGTEESYFSAMSTLFEFSQNCNSWLKAIASAAQPLQRQDMDLLNSTVQQHNPLQRWEQLESSLIGKEHVPLSLWHTHTPAHDSPKMYGYILTSRNLRTNMSAWITSARLPRTWNSASAEIMWFLQSQAPLPWKMLRRSQLNPVSFMRADVIIGQGLTTWGQLSFASIYEAKQLNSLLAGADSICYIMSSCRLSK